MEESLWNQFTEEAESTLLFKILQQTVDQFNKGFNGMDMLCISKCIRMGVVSEGWWQVPSLHEENYSAHAQSRSTD